MNLTHPQMSNRMEDISNIIIHLRPIIILLLLLINIQVQDKEEMEDLEVLHQWEGFQTYLLMVPITSQQKLHSDLVSNEMLFLYICIFVFLYISMLIMVKIN